jgi:hypothetical protein
VGGVAQAQSICDAGVTKAAGTKVACKTKVIAKAQRHGVAADTAKLAKCETKFDSSCTKAQGMGDCTAQTQPCDAVEIGADACVGSFSGAFVQSICDAGVTKAVGTKVACETQVIAQAQKKGVPADPAKLAKCETKFGPSCTKAQGMGGCTAQTQPCDAVEIGADACVDDLSGETCTGVRVGHHCWFLGAQGADCDATCAAQGLVYDPATASYAGSGGTFDQCRAVLTALGVTGVDLDGASFGGIGCAALYNGFGVFLVRDSAPTVSGAFESGSLRACACM